MGLDERVKPRHTRDAHPNSNSIPTVQIRNPLSSRYASQECVISSSNQGKELMFEDCRKLAAKLVLAADIVSHEQR